MSRTRTAPFVRMNRDVIQSICNDNGLSIKHVDRMYAIIDVIQEQVWAVNDGANRQGQEFMNSLCSLLSSVKDSRPFRTDNRRE